MISPMPRLIELSRAPLMVRFISFRCFELALSSRWPSFASTYIVYSNRREYRVSMPLDYTLYARQHALYMPFFSLIANLLLYRLCFA